MQNTVAIRRDIYFLDPVALILITFRKKLSFFPHVSRYQVCTRTHHSTPVHVCVYKCTDSLQTTPRSGHVCIAWQLCLFAACGARTCPARCACVRACVCVRARASRLCGWLGGPRLASLVYTCILLPSCGCECARCGSCRDVWSRGVLHCLCRCARLCHVVAECCGTT